MVHEREYFPENPNATVKVSPLVAFLVGLPVINGTALAHRPKEFERFLKFASVGVLGMVIHNIILNVLVKVVGLPAPAANPVGFTVAVISNFTWNRVWTFPESRERPILRQLAQFGAVNLVGLGINQLVFSLVLMAIRNVIPDPFNYNLAWACAVGVVLFWNFFVNRFWTYKGIE